MSNGHQASSCDKPSATMVVCTPAQALLLSRSCGHHCSCRCRGQSIWRQAAHAFKPARQLHRRPGRPGQQPAFPGKAVGLQQRPNAQLVVVHGRDCASCLLHCFLCCCRHLADLNVEGCPETGRPLRQSTPPQKHAAPKRRASSMTCKAPPLPPSLLRLQTAPAIHGCVGALQPSSCAMSCISPGAHRTADGTGLWQSKKLHR